MEQKLTTVIVNATNNDLLMKVGTRNCFVPLAVVARRGHHALDLCLNWTFQEFSLEEKNNVTGKTLFVNSDDCCDYERITVTEADGKLVADRVPRRQVMDGNYHGGVVAWISSWWSRIWC